MIAPKGARQLAVRMPEDVREQIKEVAASEGRSVNTEIICAVRAWIEAKGVTLTADA